jgi:hypothetical protein
MLHEFTHYMRQPVPSDAKLAGSTSTTPTSAAAAATVTDPSADLLQFLDADTTSLLPPYSIDELYAAWGRLTSVSLHEPLAVAAPITAYAFASGASLGAVGWEFVVRGVHDHFRLVYLSRASGQLRRISRSLDLDVVCGAFASTNRTTPHFIT